MISAEKSTIRDKMPIKSKDYDFSVLIDKSNVIGFGEELNKPGIDLKETLLSHDKEIQANTNRMNELEQKILKLENEMFKFKRQILNFIGGKNE